MKRFNSFVSIICIAMVFTFAAAAPVPRVVNICGAGVAEAAVYSLDTVLSLLASIGGAGAVIIIVAATTGYAGCVALVAALALLGGPFGILGGVFATAGISVLIYAIGQYGVDYVMERLVLRWKEQGKSVSEIEDEINNMSSVLVSYDTKAKAIAYVRRYM